MFVEEKCVIFQDALRFLLQLILKPKQLKGMSEDMKKNLHHSIAPLSHHVTCHVSDIRVSQQGRSGIRDSDPLNHGSDSPCQLSHTLLYYFQFYWSYVKK